MTFRRAENPLLFLATLGAQGEMTEGLLFPPPKLGLNTKGLAVQVKEPAVQVKEP